MVGLDEVVDGIYSQGQMLSTESRPGDPTRAMARTVCCGAIKSDGRG